jgi:haloalkane dehalogenase
MTGDRPAASDVNAVIDAHERSGYRLAVGGVETFVLDFGHGQPVVCLHGVPASSFLYRKLIVELAARGLRGIAFDLPGAGTCGAARGLRLHLDRPWPIRIRRG